MEINLDKLEKEAEIHVLCLEEHAPIRGNASAIDEETDKKNEESIIMELESGNEWAWCTIAVYAEYEGIKGLKDYLGCCSYKSKEDFLKDGYYEDMKDQALKYLKEAIEGGYEKYEQAIRDLS